MRRDWIRADKLAKGGASQTPTEYHPRTRGICFGGPRMTSVILSVPSLLLGLSVPFRSHASRWNRGREIAHAWDGDALIHGIK